LTENHSNHRPYAAAWFKPRRRRPGLDSALWIYGIIAALAGFRQRAAPNRAHNPLAWVFSLTGAYPKRSAAPGRAQSVWPFRRP